MRRHVEQGYAVGHTGTEQLAAAQAVQRKKRLLAAPERLVAGCLWRVGEVGDALVRQAEAAAQRARQRHAEGADGAVAGT